MEKEQNLANDPNAEEGHPASVNDSIIDEVNESELATVEQYVEDALLAEGDENRDSFGVNDEQPLALTPDGEKSFEDVL